ncbi:hypothetical protein HKX48_007892 [Thoreauomyces humboldtii]|nr:hypothetical protein HKX48_007892 [Thoreauomyces humboldtii]
MSGLTLALGVIRALSCGVFVFVTSTDDHMIHDVGMITYLVAGLLYMGCLTWLSWRTSQFGKETGWKFRLRCIVGFLALIPCLVYFFIQHKVERVPGAYSYYAVFEWAVILFDVAFDHATAIDVRDVSVQVVLPKLLAQKFKQEPELESVAVPRKPLSITPGLYATVQAHLAETYLGFVFWSMTTSLGLTIWYFPLWNMGMSGFEAFLFTSLSPALLAIPPIRRFVFRSSAILHLFSLVGLMAYRLEDPVLRLSAVGTGVGLSFLAWVSALVDVDGISSDLVQPCSWKPSLSLLLGLILSSIAKVTAYSNNPVWPTMNPSNGGFNDLGAGLGVLACMQIFFRSVAEARTAPIHNGHVETLKENAVHVQESRRGGVWPAAALGLGALLFSLHSMLTDSGIICLWATEGYPNPGPPPLLGGVAVLLVMGAGLLASQHMRFATSSFWWLAGTAGVMALYFLPRVSVFGRAAGFFGGLVYAGYIMSLAPALLQQLAFYPVGRTMTVGLITYNVLQLAHVWVVAYAFVPGGPLARERTHFVVAATQFLLLLGAVTARTSLTAAETREPPVAAHKSRTHAYQRAGSTLMVLYAILAVAVGARLSLRKIPVPYHADDQVMTMGIWTVHFGLDDQLYSSHERMASVIRELELDVIGLLETDTYRIIMGNRDLTQYLGETLGMYVDYGPSPTKHTWGCSMLSKFPILKSEHLMLPSPVGELACAIHATLDVFGKEVDVIVSHNGQEEDPLDRELQTRTLADIMKKTSPNPFVFLGYVVTHPGLAHDLYRRLVVDGDMQDVDTTDWDRWCQYIMFRGLDRVGYARVSHGQITDTEIQTAKFTFMKDPPVDGSTSKLRRIEEEHVPEAQKYPEQFAGDGVRGHRFHCNTPRRSSVSSTSTTQAPTPKIKANVIMEHSKTLRRPLGRVVEAVAGTLVSPEDSCNVPSELETYCGFSGLGMLEVERDAPPRLRADAVASFMTVRADPDPDSRGG